jgi:uncharacterized membrane protein
MEPRPRLKIDLTGPDRLIETTGWLALALLWFLVLINYARLPDTIPTHFNAAGKADDFGNKSSILLLPVTGTIFFIIMTILCRFPHKLNYPANITIENARRLYTNATRMLRYLKLIIALMFSWIILKTVQIAGENADGLGGWFLPVALVLLLVPVGCFVVRIVRAK